MALTNSCFGHIFIETDCMMSDVTDSYCLSKDDSYQIKPSDAERVCRLPCTNRQSHVSRVGKFSLKGS